MIPHDPSMDTPFPAPDAPDGAQESASPLADAVGANQRLLHVVATRMASAAGTVAGTMAAAVAVPLKLVVSNTTQADRGAAAQDDEADRDDAGPTDDAVDSDEAGDPNALQPGATS